VKVAIIGQDSDSFRLISSRISEFHEVVHIVDSDLRAFHRLKRRIKRKGFIWGFDHVLFLFYIKLLGFVRNIQSKNLNEYRALANKIETENTNEYPISKYIEEYGLEAIIICTNRIISREFLRECRNVPVYNIHVGYLPNYRGVYGGFWAIFNKELDKVGVTVHLVEPGIDTGSIVFRGCLDGWKDYSILQLPLIQINKALESHEKWLLNRPVIIEKNSDIYPIYYHPTLTEMFKFLIRR